MQRPPTCRAEAVVGEQAPQQRRGGRGLEGRLERATAEGVAQLEAAREEGGGVDAAQAPARPGRGPDCRPGTSAASRPAALAWQALRGPAPSCTLPSREGGCSAISKCVDGRATTPSCILVGRAGPAQRSIKCDPLTPGVEAVLWRGQLLGGAGRAAPRGRQGPQQAQLGREAALRALQVVHALALDRLRCLRARAHPRARLVYLPLCLCYQNFAGWQPGRHAAHAHVQADDGPAAQPGALPTFSTLPYSTLRCGRQPRTQASRARRLHLSWNQALAGSGFSAQPRAASAARASGNGPVSTNTRAPGARPARRRQAARPAAQARWRAVSAWRLRRACKDFIQGVSIGMAGLYRQPTYTCGPRS